MSDLIGNPEDRFSHDMTQIKQRVQHVWVSVVNSFRSCDIEHYMNVSVLIKFSQKTSIFTLIIIILHKIICFGCVLDSPR